MDNSQGALLNDINIYVTLIYIYHEIKVNFKIPRLFPLCPLPAPHTPLPPCSYHTGKQDPLRSS